jgi:hypothetical protein
LTSPFIALKPAYKSQKILELILKVLETPLVKDNVIGQSDSVAEAEAELPVIPGLEGDKIRGVVASPPRSEAGLYVLLT